MADLSDLKVANEGKRLDLRHPTSGAELTYEISGEKRTMFLLIGSSDSEVYKKSQRKIIDRRLSQQQKSRKSKITAIQIEEEALISLSDITLGGCVFLGGKEVQVTPGKAAADLYRDYDWIREQASDFLEDRSNFLPS